MKNLLLISAILFAFSACDDDNNDDEMDNPEVDATLLEPFVGTWVTPEILSDCAEGNRQCNGDDLPCPAVKLIIGANGTYTFNNNLDNVNEAGSIDLTDKEITLCPDGKGCGFGNSYTFNSGSLRVSVYDGAEECTSTFEFDKG